MEYLLLHGYTWVPPQYRAPAFAALACLFVYIGWKTPVGTARFARLGYFALASAAYFSLASPAMLTDTAHGATGDPAKVTAIGFLIVAILLFLISWRVHEKRASVSLGPLRLIKGDEGAA